MVKPEGLSRSSSSPEEHGSGVVLCIHVRLAAGGSIAYTGLIPAITYLDFSGSFDEVTLILGIY